MGRIDTMLGVMDQWIASYHKDVTWGPAWAKSSESIRVGGGITLTAVEDQTRFLLRNRTRRYKPKPQLTSLLHIATSKVIRLNMWLCYLYKCQMYAPRRVTNDLGPSYSCRQAPPKLDWSYTGALPSMLTFLLAQKLSTHPT